MSAALSVAVAATFVWLGVVLAISFIEAPLKFRAPGITIPLGLGIGRLVFRALNAAEAVLAIVLAWGLVLGSPPLSGVAAVVVAAVLVGIALIASGAIVGLLSGAPMVSRALRQLAIGYGAAAVTYLLGLAFGTALA